MKKMEKIGMILVNYLGALFVIGLGTPMLPDHLQLPWFLFNGWLWIVSPIVIILADRKETRK